VRAAGAASLYKLRFVVLPESLSQPGLAFVRSGFGHGLRAKALANELFPTLAIAQQRTRQFLTAWRAFVSVKRYEVPPHFG
jgi:hypothetical protein